MNDINQIFCNFLLEHFDEESVELWNNDINSQNLITKIIETSQKNKNKKIKDANKPKRGKSAYIYFCQDRRNDVKKELGEYATTAEITSQLGIYWNVLKENAETDEQFTEIYEKYLTQAAEDKIRYEKEMENYEAPSQEDLINEKKEEKRKKIKDDNKPKRAKSSYIYFCQEKRSELKKEFGNSTKEITSELGRLWKELKDNEEMVEEYKKYQDMACNDKLRYVQEMEEYNSNDGVNSETKSENDSTDTESTNSNSIKPRITGYVLFCKEERANVKEKNPEQSGSDITKILSFRWKEMSKEEQQEWKDKAAN